MNVTFFLFSGNWIGKYSCWINTVSFWWDKAHSIAMKENTGEVKEASYRCSEMKPKPDTVHMVNKLTLMLQPLWRGCPKPLLSSRKIVLCGCVLIFFPWDLWKFVISDMTESIKHLSNSTRGTETDVIHLGNICQWGSYSVVWVSTFQRLVWINQLLEVHAEELVWLWTQCKHMLPVLWRGLQLSHCIRKSLPLP